MQHTTLAVQIRVLQTYPVLSMAGHPTITVEPGRCYPPTAVDAVNAASRH